ncbi:coiled-coil domain-containing protein 61-like [Anneissia japonica]|uniref:coiled-coil domain-containing protein 61-like n=1 Tax=Anneissia japonica TaxID=1529436 RepID=UPI0014258545|nr:coiled-coil domain-containing protein 61-like [Anneissia japonica]
MENNVSCMCVFRGVEYVVTATRLNDDQLMVEVEDRVTADQWRNTFDATYIEDLTHKTGNFKQFSIFVNMLNSALSKTSESVNLDLLTYTDLESLRNRKAGATSRNIPGPQKAALNSKRYLIVTYTVEFDRIHYPLPLPYQGKPDPVLLQNTVRDLKIEIKHLKKQLQPEYRNVELHRLQKDYEILLQEKQELEASYLQFRRELKMTSKGSSVKEIRILKNAVKNTEEELINERRKFQRSTAKRNQEFKNLVEEVEELRASERNLRVRVKSLTNELAVYKRSGRSPSVLPPSRLSHHKPVRKSLSTQERAREASRQRSKSRERAFSREPRHRSTSRGRTPSLSSIGSRSPSPAGARVPRFNPTAYIEDKKKKQQETKSKIERRKRFDISGISSLDRRSRSRSRTQRKTGNSRTSSVDSRGSRRSSAGLSDVEYMSDNSQGRSRELQGVLKHGRTPNSSYWVSPNVTYKKSSVGKARRVMSTPDPVADHSRVRKPLANKTNKRKTYQDDYYDRSAEMSDIDARLVALQEFMKTNIE